MHFLNLYNNANGWNITMKFHHAYFYVIYYIRMLINVNDMPSNPTKAQHLASAMPS